MTALLPPESRIEVRGRAGAPTAASLARADGAVLLVDGEHAERALSRLPHAALWLALHRKAKPRPGRAPMMLVARLPNARHTLTVVSFARHGQSAFDRLEASRSIAQAVLESGVAQLHCGVELARADDATMWREAIVSALLAAAAPMPNRKTKAPPPSDLRRIDVFGAKTADFAASVSVAAGNHLARWLATLPPNELTCVTYRRALRDLARREGWSFRFYDERALARLGAGAFLAVARANAHRGAGIVRLRYRAPGRGARPRIGLVGKGICFDTGGINLKSQKGMYLMHGDMQGSAVAVGTLLSCSRSRARLDIDCWLALTENEIGPRSYRPQDIVRASNGITIQVVHSDAEGRMALADTLVLASRERPQLLLDFATLTGACVNALTERYSGAFTNDTGLQQPVQAAGRESGERVWCFPMDEDYDEDIESTVADLMQCTMDSKGDHILAARFLGHFVERSVPWVHVDLSSAERKGGLGHVPTEFTGFGVRFATRLLSDSALLGRLAEGA